MVFETFGTFDDALLEIDKARKELIGADARARRARSSAARLLAVESILKWW